MLALGALTILLLQLRQHVDDDAWLHTRIGAEIRDGQRFRSLPDPLVALADRPYLPSQWLSEVIGSAMFDLVGLTGFWILRAAALVVLFASVYSTARLWFRPLAAVGTTAVVTFATAAAWGERPQLAGLALAAAILLLWARRRQNVGSSWTVIPLMWVWAMLHGSWIIGLAVGGLFVALEARGARTAPGRYRRSLALLAGSCVVIALTPLGPAALVAPFDVSSAAQATVSEWQRPAATNPLFISVLLASCAAVVRVVRSRTCRLEVVLFGIAAAGLAIYSVRTVAFGALLLTPAIGMAFGGARTAQGLRLERLVLVGTALMVLCAPGVLWNGPDPTPVGPEIDRALGDLPEGTVAAVEVGISGWVLANHAHLVPLRDLRAEVYSRRTARSYAAFSRADPGWEDVADTWSVRAALIPVGDPLDVAVRARGDWNEVATDGEYRLWSRD